MQENLLFNIFYIYLFHYTIHMQRYTMKKFFTLFTCIFMLSIRLEAQVQLSNLPVQQPIHGCWYNPDTRNGC